LICSFSGQRFVFLKSVFIPKCHYQHRKRRALAQETAMLSQCKWFACTFVCVFAQGCHRSLMCVFFFFACLVSYNGGESVSQQTSSVPTTALTRLSDDNWTLYETPEGFPSRPPDAPGFQFFRVIVDHWKKCVESGDTKNHPLFTRPNNHPLFPTSGTSCSVGEAEENKKLGSWVSRISPQEGGDLSDIAFLHTPEHRFPINRETRLRCVKDGLLPSVLTVNDLKAKDDMIAENHMVLVHDDLAMPPTMCTEWQDMTSDSRLVASWSPAYIETCRKALWKELNAGKRTTGKCYFLSDKTARFLSVNYRLISPKVQARDRGRDSENQYSACLFHDFALYVHIDLSVHLCIKLGARTPYLKVNILLPNAYVSTAMSGGLGTHTYTTQGSANERKNYQTKVTTKMTLKTMYVSPNDLLLRVYPPSHYSKEPAPVITVRDFLTLFNLAWATPSAASDISDVIYRAGISFSALTADQGISDDNDPIFTEMRDYFSWIADASAVETGEVAFGKAMILRPSADYDKMSGKNTQPRSSDLYGKEAVREYIHAYPKTKAQSRFLKKFDPGCFSAAALNLTVMGDLFDATESDLTLETTDKAKGFHSKKKKHEAIRAALDHVNADREKVIQKQMLNEDGSLIPLGFTHANSALVTEQDLHNHFKQRHSPGDAHAYTLMLSMVHASRADFLALTGGMDDDLPAYTPPSNIPHPPQRLWRTHLTTRDGIRGIRLEAHPDDWVIDDSITVAERNALREKKLKDTLPPDFSFRILPFLFTHGLRPRSLDIEPSNDMAVAQLIFRKVVDAASDGRLFEVDFYRSFFDNISTFLFDSKAHSNSLSSVSVQLSKNASVEGKMSMYINGISLRRTLKSTDSGRMDNDTAMWPRSVFDPRGEMVFSAQEMIDRYITALGWDLVDVVVGSDEDIYTRVYQRLVQFVQVYPTRLKMFMCVLETEIRHQRSLSGWAGSTTRALNGTQGHSPPRRTQTLQTFGSTNGYEIGGVSGHLDHLTTDPAFLEVCSLALEGARAREFSAGKKVQEYLCRMQEPAMHRKNTFESVVAMLAPLQDIKDALAATGHSRHPINSLSAESAFTRTVNQISHATLEEYGVSTPVEWLLKVSAALLALVPQVAVLPQAQHPLPDTSDIDSEDAYLSDTEDTEEGVLTVPPSPNCMAGGPLVPQSPYSGASTPHPPGRSRDEILKSLVSLQYQGVKAVYKPVDIAPAQPPKYKSDRTMTGSGTPVPVYSMEDVAYSTDQAYLDRIATEKALAELKKLAPSLTLDAFSESLREKVYRRVKPKDRFMTRRQAKGWEQAWANLPSLTTDDSSSSPSSSSSSLPPFLVRVPTRRSESSASTRPVSPTSQRRPFSQPSQSISAPEPVRIPVPSFSSSSRPSPVNGSLFHASASASQSDADERQRTYSRDRDVESRQSSDEGSDQGDQASDTDLMELGITPDIPDVLDDRRFDDVDEIEDETVDSDSETQTQNVIPPSGRVKRGRIFIVYFEYARGITNIDSIMSVCLVLDDDRTARTSGKRPKVEVSAPARGVSKRVLDANQAMRRM